MKLVKVNSDFYNLCRRYDVDKELMYNEVGYDASKEAAITLESSSYH